MSDTVLLWVITAVATLLVLGAMVGPNLVSYSKKRRKK